MSDAQQNRQQKPLLVIHNVHFPNCGEPPSFEVTPETAGYHGYFENEHGEQWVFVYDYDSETGTVRGGDAGWEDVYAVVDGCAKNLIVGAEEQMWLDACWAAATWGKDYRDEKRAGKV